MNRITKAKNISFILWGLSILGFFVSFFWVIKTSGGLEQNSEQSIGALFALLAFLLLGVGSFLLGTTLLTWNRLRGESKHNTLLKGILAVLIQPIFPLYYLSSLGKSYIQRRPKLKDSRHLGVLVGLFAFLPFWFLGYFLLFFGGRAVLGLGPEFAPVLSSESMAPTIPGGTGYRYYHYKNIWYRLNSSRKHQFEHGDIVSFSTPTTRKLTSEAGINDYNFFKRVIGLPGDTIVVKGGLVYRNGEALDERYTLEANKTYAGDIKDENGKVLAKGFFQECEEVVVPPQSLFVLGDNRQHSDDSRIIGFVGFDDVTAYLPWDEQHVEYYEGVNRFKHDEKWRSESTLTDEALKQAEQYCK